MGNKVKFGLKHIHYAVITEEADGSITYGVPKALKGGVSISLNAKGDKTEFYADDGLYFGASANQGYEGDLEIALLDDTFRVDVLGDEVDANGAVFENADAIPKKIALMFEFSGDANAVRHVTYNVTVARPSIESKTKESSITPQTEKISIQASPHPETGRVRGKLDQGKTGYDTFYNSVYEYVEA